MLFWIILIAFGLPVLGFLLQMKKQRKLHENKLASIQSKLAEIERKKVQSSIDAKRAKIEEKRRHD